MAKTPDFKYNRTIGELLSEQRKPKTIPDTAWREIGDGSADEIVLEGTWINDGDLTTPNPAFYLSEDGEVRLRGKVREGTDLIVVLPEECRPEFDMNFIVYVYDTDNNGIELSEIRFRSFQQ